MKYQGRIQQWDDAKGFGFVEPNGGGSRAFAHIKAFKHPSRRPVNGDIIIYEVEQDKQGSHRAHNISLLKDYKSKRAKSAKQTSQNKLTLALLILFSGAITLLVSLGQLPSTVLVAYFTLSTIAFLLYGADKSAAKKNKWRISEAKLHVFSLLGGWPGAFAAQHVFKHKRSKPAFMKVFWTTVTANIIVLALVALEIINVNALDASAIPQVLRFWQ